MSDALSGRGPSIAMLETSSIARGIEATDAMMKRAAVDLLMTTIVPRGKYLVMVGGAVADVEAALRAGLDTAGPTVVDHFLIQNVHPQLPAAIKGKVKVDSVEAIGLIETKEVASAIYRGRRGGEGGRGHADRGAEPAGRQGPGRPHRATWAPCAPRWPRARPR